MRLEPDLRYCSPEMSAGGRNPNAIRYATPGGDVFSVGVLALELYRFNLKLLPERRPHLSAMPLDINSTSAVENHQSSVDALALMDYSYLPNGLPQLLQRMVTKEASHRPSTADISNDVYFATGNLAVLRAVDSLPLRDVGTQVRE